jgi:ABC-type multidrug transport system permease subunit
MLTSILALHGALLAGSGLLSLLVTLVVVGLIFWVLWWFLGYINPPEPFNKVARVILGLFALIFVVNLLLGLIGKPLF